MLPINPNNDTQLSSSDDPGSSDLRLGTSSLPSLSPSCSCDGHSHPSVTTPLSTARNFHHHHSARSVRAIDGRCWYLVNFSDRRRRRPPHFHCPRAASRQWPLVPNPVTHVIPSHQVPLTTSYLLVPTAVPPLPTSLITR